MKIKKLIAFNALLTLNLPVILSTVSCDQDIVNPDQALINKIKTLLENKQGFVLKGLTIDNTWADAASALNHSPVLENITQNFLITLQDTKKAKLKLSDDTNKIGLKLVVNKREALITANIVGIKNPNLDNVIKFVEDDINDQFSHLNNFDNRNNFDDLQNWLNIYEKQMVKDKYGNNDFGLAIKINNVSNLKQRLINNSNLSLNISLTKPKNNKIVKNYNSNFLTKPMSLYDYGGKNYSEVLISYFSQASSIIQTDAFENQFTIANTFGDFINAVTFNCYLAHYKFSIYTVKPHDPESNLKSGIQHYNLRGCAIDSQNEFPDVPLNVQITINVSVPNK